MVKKSTEVRHQWFHLTPHGNWDKGCVKVNGRVTQNNPVPSIRVLTLVHSKSPSYPSEWSVEWRHEDADLVESALSIARKSGSEKPNHLLD